MRRLLCCVLFFAAAVSAQSSINGPWNGAISVGPMKLQIILRFEVRDSSARAAISIPQQHVTDMPLADVRIDSPAVSFAIPIPQAKAAFAGTLFADSIAGSFKQAGVSGTFLVRRGDAPTARTVQPEPKPEPMPYKEEEVVVKNGAISLAGTLSLPPIAERHPAIVMITGSGAQDRDENLLGFKIFKILADRFTRQGLAVLRLDDRGVGGSTGRDSDPTTEDFVGDISAAVDFLRERSDIDRDRIGLFGHSEGGAIAPMLASKRDDIAFLILMAPPGLPGDSVLITQLEKGFRLTGMNDSLVKREMVFWRYLIESVKADTGKESLRAFARRKAAEEIDNLPGEQRKMITDRDEAVAARSDGLISQFYTRWFRFFLQLDPASYLDKVKIPVLALFGELDAQVLAEPNRKAFEDAIGKSGNTNVKVKVIPKANHLFQKAVSGHGAEYAALPKEFAPGFWEAISEWLANYLEQPRK